MAGVASWALMSARRHRSCARSASDGVAGVVEARARPSDAAATEDSDVVVANLVDLVVLELAGAILAHRGLEDMDGPHPMESRGERRPQGQYGHFTALSPSQTVKINILMGVVSRGKET